MLIQEALNLLTPEITTLGWVERFGGVVRTISRAFEDQNGEPKYKRYPVSCSVSETDCENDQRYQDLVPDSSKSSVLFWDVTRGLYDVGQVERINARAMRGSARLIGWLNTDRLGVNECNTAAKAIRSLLPIIFRKFENNTAGDLFTNSTVRFEFAGEAIKDDAIFQKWDFSRNSGFLMHPYDFFAIDVNIFAVVSLCEYVMDTGTPIDCTDDSRLIPPN